MYKKGDQVLWKGRQDPGSKRDVWHQVVKAVNLNEGLEAGICFLGFCSDLGVKRNLGRVGAVNGPEAIRKAMVNLAVHFSEGKVHDGGDVIVSGDRLEEAQDELSNYTRKLFSMENFPILMGGGHEISYGHVKGALDYYLDSRVGVINFDPHFDLRDYPQGAHSGSWAKQLFDEYEDRFSYLPVGINPAVNIASMFELMRQRNQSFITMDELLSESYEELNAQILHFLEQVDHVCVTLDLDIFSAGIAPGVSAANPYGVFPQYIKPFIEGLLKSEKSISFDVAEMNPAYDDGRTAKLAASFIYDVVMKRS